MTDELPTVTAETRSVCDVGLQPQPPFMSRGCHHRSYQTGQTTGIAINKAIDGDV